MSKRRGVYRLWSAQSHTSGGCPGGCYTFRLDGGDGDEPIYYHAMRGWFWGARRITASGQYAECRDCVGLIDPDYGGLVYPRAEFLNDGDKLADRWVSEHTAAHPGHRPTVGRFHHWAVLCVNVDPDVLSIIRGDDDA